MSYEFELGDSAGLREYYALRTEFESALKQFRSWHNLWKASVLVDTSMLFDDEDEQARDNAESSYARLQSLYKRTEALRTRLGLPLAPLELPEDEYAETVTPIAYEERQARNGR